MRAASIRHISFVLAVVLVAPIDAIPQTTTHRPSSRSADEYAIRALIQKCIDGWNKGSGEALAAQFADDADYVIVNGMHLKGRQQIASAHQQILDTVLKGSQLSINVKSLRFLEPDVALLHTVGRVTTPSDPTAAPQPENIQTLVATKRKGKWLLDAFHTTPIQAGQGEPAAKPSSRN